MTETERKRYIASGWDMTPKKKPRNYFQEARDSESRSERLEREYWNGILLIYAGGGLFAILLVILSWAFGLFDLYK